MSLDDMIEGLLDSTDPRKKTKDPNESGKKKMNETKTQILIITEWITIIGTLLGCFFFLTARIDQQAARTDRLYEMFIDLLKEGKK